MSVNFLIIGLAFLAILISNILSIKFRIPVFIFLIFFGTILGPHVLGIIKEESSIDIFADIGAALLFFVIGLKFNLDSLRSLGKEPIIIFLLEFFISFFGIFSILNIIGLEYYQSLFLSLVFSNSTLAIISQLINIRNRSNEFLFKNLTAVSLLEDLSLVILLLITITLVKFGNVSFEYLTFEIIKRISILLLSLYIIQYFLQKIIPKIENYGEDSILTLSLGIAGILISILTLYGIPLSIAAFLAGSIFSSTYSKKQIGSTIEKLSNLFISIFFISIGLNINPNELFSLNSTLILTTILFSIFFFKFFGNLIANYLVYSDFQLAVRSAIYMIVIGESSIYLTYYGMKLGIVNENFLGIVGMIVLSSILLSFALSKRDRKIIEFLEDIGTKKGLQKIRKGLLDLISGIKKYKDAKEIYINLGIEIFFSIILILLISITINYFENDVIISTFTLLFLLSIFLTLVWHIIMKFVSLIKYLDIKYFGKNEWKLAVLYFLTLIFLCIFSLTFPRNQFGKIIDIVIILMLIFGIYNIFKINNEKRIYKYRRKS
ncbi:MAG: cation:proton antiporter [Candidatus Aenigmatarchaeota archaeon]